MAARTREIGLDATARAEVGRAVPSVAVIAADPDGIRVEQGFGLA
jgi:hypothetical protein